MRMTIAREATTVRKTMTSSRHLPRPGLDPPPGQGPPALVNRTQGRLGLPNRRPGGAEVVPGDAVMPGDAVVPGDDGGVSLAGSGRVHRV